MGENANVSWGWHNTEVGKGYQARGVVRQPGVHKTQAQVIDMREQEERKGVSRSSIVERKDQDRKSVKKSSKREKKVSTSSKKAKKMFNPILQQFAAALSDTTRSFAVH